MKISAIIVLEIIYWWFAAAIFLNMKVVFSNQYQNVNQLQVHLDSLNFDNIKDML